MQIKAFAQNMLRFIDGLAKEQTNEDKNVLVKLELMETLECLKQILLYCAEIDGAEVTIETLKIFKDFLAERWEKIKNTDSVYFLKPKALTNCVCALLAHKIADTFQLTDYEILMPTLQCTVLEKERLKKALLHEFVLTAYGNLIFVADFVQALNKKNLCSTDQEILTNHSMAVARLLEPNKSPNEMLQKINSFKEEIKKPTYEVTASYGQAGNSILWHFRNAGIKDKNDLVRILSEALTKKEWPEFLKYIHTDHLIKLILNVNRAEMQEAAGFNIDIMVPYNKKIDENWLNLLTQLKTAPEIPHIRALCYCLVDLYERQRQADPDEYKSATGYYVGSYLPTWTTMFTKTYSKSDRLLHCKLIKEFLISDRPMGELAAFLMENKIDAYYSGFFGANCRFGDIALIIRDGKEGKQPILSPGAP